MDLVTFLHANLYSWDKVYLLCAESSVICFGLIDYDDVFTLSSQTLSTLGPSVFISFVLYPFCVFLCVVKVWGTHLMYKNRLLYV